MSLETVRVDLADRSYDIRIGDGLLTGIGAEIAPLLNRRQVAVVTDETVGALHLETLKAGLADAGIGCACLTLPAGEATKSWSSLQRTVEWLLAERIERDDLVIAFGGGVIGDLTGFAAAILRRGVRFVQVPTSLLAQVDSSVGGKTGINASVGKNLVGAFSQPALVLADTGVLNTLTPRDFLAGCGEVVKYGLLGDAEFFAWLEANGPAMVAGDAAARRYAVRRSCEMKAAIVARDELEQGDRALLNLGHTFGHALEAATGYSDRLLHGEGVAIGCLLAFALSQRLGQCSQECASRIRQLYGDMKMKAELSDITGENIDANDLVERMLQDKKVRAGQPRYILARDIGAAFVAEDVDLSDVRAVLRAGLEQRRSAR